MIKLIKFLIGAFSDKEGSARFSGAIIVCVATCWLIFTPLIAFKAFKEGQDLQNRLLWKDQALIRDTLGKNKMYVPALTLEDSTTNQP